MPENQRTSQPHVETNVGALIGGFRVEQLISSSGDEQIFRAREGHVDRLVLLHVAGPRSVDSLLDDARRLSGVPHPSLAPVLGASRSDTGGYAAVAALDARPLSDVASLSAEQAARIGIDISGAISALAESGMRAAVNSATVLVVRTSEGVRGVLDPLRAGSSDASRLTEPDPIASTGELIDLLDRAAGSQRLSGTLDGLRNRAASRPTELASALAPLVAAPGRGRRRPTLLVAGCLTLAVVAVVVIAHERSSKPAALPTLTARAPVARIVKHIPLGMSKGESMAAFTTAANSVWIATSRGRILRVDAATNQVVGSPIELGRQHYAWALVASGGLLYSTDAAGWLLRIDPSTGKITGRRHLAPQLTAMEAVNGVLWIVSSSLDQSKSSVIRVDARSLRSIGKPVNALARPLHLQVRGTRAWVLGGDGTGEVVRVDVKSGERKAIWVGPNPVAMALAGNTLWISDRFNGTVSGLDAERMDFRREAVATPVAALGLSAVGSDLWVAASDELSNGRVRIERLDARSGRRVGRALVIGPNGLGMAVGLGSIWLMTDTDIVRIVPSPRQAALAPVPRLSASPQALAPGPLRGGTWRSTAIVTPFTFAVPAFKWLSIVPGPDAAWLQTVGSRYAELAVNVPREVFAADGGPLVKVGSPANLLAVVRRNPHFVVGAVHHATIGGRPALQFELRARNAARHAEVCGPHPCVLLFPVRDATIAIPSGELARVALLSSRGRTVAIVEGGNGDDRKALAESASVLRTFHFAA